MKTFNIFFGSSMFAITTFVYTNSFLLLMVCLFFIISFVQFKFSFSGKYEGIIIPAASFVISLFLAYMFKDYVFEIMVVLNIPTCIYILEFLYLRFITKKDLA